MEGILIVRDNRKNMLDCCDYVSVCVVVPKFTELSINMLHEGLTLALSTSQKRKIGEVLHRYFTKVLSKQFK